MTTKEMRIAVSMMKTAAEQLGNAGCNDLDSILLIELGPHERTDLLAAYNKYNGGDPADYITRADSIPDFGLLGYLAHRLERIAKELECISS